MNRDWLKIAITYLLAATAAALFAFYVLGAQTRVSSDWQQATATIQQIGTNTGDRCYAYATYDANGKPATVTSPWANSPCPYAVGQQLTIAYNPNTGDDYIVTEPKLDYWGFLAAAGVLALVGLISFVLAFARRKKEDGQGPRIMFALGMTALIAVGAAYAFTKIAGPGYTGTEAVEATPYASVAVVVAPEPETMTELKQADFKKALYARWKPAMTPPKGTAFTSTWSSPQQAGATLEQVTVFNPDGSTSVTHLPANGPTPDVRCDKDGSCYSGNDSQGWKPSTAPSVSMKAYVKSLWTALMGDDKTIYKAGTGSFKATYTDGVSRLITFTPDSVTITTDTPATATLPASQSTEIITFTPPTPVTTGSPAPSASPSAS